MAATTTRTAKQSSDHRDPSRLVRAPNPSSQSDHNMNAPVKRYLTSPNRARFQIGDPVILADTHYSSPYVGHVEGYAGGTAVWVKWPHLVDQHPVEELINVHPDRNEWAFSGNPGGYAASQSGRRGPTAARRTAGPFQDKIVMDRLRQLGVHEQDIMRVDQAYEFHAAKQKTPQAPETPATMEAPSTPVPGGAAGAHGPPMTPQQQELLNRDRAYRQSLDNDVTMAPRGRYDISLDSNDDEDDVTKTMVPSGSTWGALESNSQEFPVRAGQARRAGIATLKRAAAAQRNPRVRRQLLATARTAAALSSLYEMGQHRQAADEVAIRAMRRSILGSLRVADRLRASSREADAAAVEVATLNAFAYPSR